MKVQEVSGVDRPANLRPFLLLKQDDMPPTSTAKNTVPVQAAAPPPEPPPPQEAAPPAEAQPGKLGPLPAAVKQAVLDASAGAIERIQAMAIAVGEAPTDEAAAVPGEIAAAFESVAESMVQLAASMKPKPPAPPAPDPAAPPPAPPAPAQKSLDAETEKVVTINAACTMWWEVESAMRGGDVEAAKAKVAAFITVLDAALAKLSGAAPAVDPAQMAEQAKAANRTTTDFAPLLQQMTKFVESQQAELTKSAELKASIDRLAVQVGTMVSRAVIKTSVPSGNGQPAEKGAGPAPAPFHWPADIAASAKERRNKERGS